MAANYPLTVFHFQVEWNGSRVGFTEASGLTQELTPIEYREGSSYDYHVTKFPGMRKFTDISLKRGIFQNDNEFTEWFLTVRKDKIERRDLTISLLDENHDPVMTWTIRQAWPSKVEGPSFKSTGNEVAVESITLVHEGLEVTL
jgi:phage tail-like protein